MSTLGYGIKPQKAIYPLSGPTCQTAKSLRLSTRSLPSLRISISRLAMHFSLLQGGPMGLTRMQPINHNLWKPESSLIPTPTNKLRLSPCFLAPEQGFLQGLASLTAPAGQ